MPNENIILQIKEPHQPNPFLLEAKLSYPNGSTKCPLVFIFPILGGKTFLENHLERQLVKRGYAVMIVDFYPRVSLVEATRDLRIHDKVLQRSILGMNALIHEVKKYPTIDHQKLGLLGMSLGGIFTTLNIILNENFKAAVIVASGGNNPLILMKSKNPFLTFLRKKRKDRYSIRSDQEYLKMMRRKFNWDPLMMKRPKIKHKILMIISQNDTHIPTTVQVKTWKFLGKPKAIFTKLSHYQLILSIPFVFNARIINFLDEKFSE
jgi:dienelactone hydrolase